MAIDTKNLGPAYKQEPIEIKNPDMDALHDMSQERMYVTPEKAIKPEETRYTTTSMPNPSYSDPNQRAHTGLEPIFDKDQTGPIAIVNPDQDTPHTQPPMMENDEGIIGDDTGGVETPGDQVENEDGTDPVGDAVAQNPDFLEEQKAAQEAIAQDPNKYLADRDLLNQAVTHDIYEKNPDGTVKKDLEGNPIVRPEFTQEAKQAGRTEVAKVDDVEGATATAGTIHTETAQAAPDVVVQEYEAELIDIDELNSSLDVIRQEKPMEAASVAEKLNGLIGDMENGNIPLWARPAVTKVEQNLAARGISASSVGRDSLFNAIINAAMPIAQADATFEQQANASNWDAKVKAILQDNAQEFAAKQFNANSINQRNQYLTGLKAQVDSQNAARKDAMAQFNANAKNQASIAGAQLATQVSLANAQMAQQAALQNQQIAAAAAQHQASLDAQREQFNTQQANVIEQANTQWRRQINMAETATQNQINAANVANAFNLSSQAQNNLWQQARDEAHWAHQASENELSRRHETAIRIMQWEHDAAMQEGAAEAGKTSAWDSTRDKLIEKGSDALVDWLFG